MIRKKYGNSSIFSCQPFQIVFHDFFKEFCWILLYKFLAIFPPKKCYIVNIQAQSIDQPQFPIFNTHEIFIVNSTIFTFSTVFKLLNFYLFVAKKKAVEKS
jgi:hypothetical protein